MHFTLITLTVRDFDEALAFYITKLGFTLLEDSDLGRGKRWVRIAPPGSTTAALLLARATTPEQLATVGNQTGGRVFLFLETDNLQRDYNLMTSRGVHFVRPPSQESYGGVAVFQDLYGNKFDLIQPNAYTPAMQSRS